MATLRLFPRAAEGHEAESVEPVYLEVAGGLGEIVGLKQATYEDDAGFNVPVACYEVRTPTGETEYVSVAGVQRVNARFETASRLRAMARLYAEMADRIEAADSPPVRFREFT